MKTLTTVTKILGLAAAFDFTPIAPSYGVLIVIVASTLKDIVAKIGDYLDDKQINGSFK